MWGGDGTRRKKRAETVFPPFSPPLIQGVGGHEDMEALYDLSDEKGNRKAGPAHLFPLSMPLNATSPGGGLVALIIELTNGRYIKLQMSPSQRGISFFPLSLFLSSPINMYEKRKIL